MDIDTHIKHSHMLSVSMGMKIYCQQLLEKLHIRKTRTTDKKQTEFFKMLNRGQKLQKHVTKGKNKTFIANCTLLIEQIKNSLILSVWCQKNDV